MNVMSVELEASHVVGIVWKMVFDRNDAGSATDDQELTFDSALRAVFGGVEIDRDFHFMVLVELFYIINIRKSELFVNPDFLF